MHKPKTIYINSRILMKFLNIAVHTNNDSAFQHILAGYMINYQSMMFKLM